MVIDISRSVLLEIDVQNDFCPAYVSVSGQRFGPGALAVTGGDEVVRPLNALARNLCAGGGRVVATQDWHPPFHVSFASAHEGKKVYETVTIPLASIHAPLTRTSLPLPEAADQTLWPDHCVQGSVGAALHADLDLGPVTYILRKGSEKGLDSYSAFFENDRRTPTGLDGLLKSLGIAVVFLGGLATDYCVLYSALDAARLGYHTVVVRDAVRGVGVPPGSVERAVELMREAGVSFMDSRDIV
ncbi:MAG: bifunctional nicotinamidase/pyrazinamidase [Spirochaetaceae bacterium]|jgi:nicotinamidase/pyrazinamidase|nr:bifunctional nicotinamidase/pyrazinamidase [Spirochaetaceae bacterium]